MTEKEKNARAKLARLQDALADDLNNISDEELILELEEIGEDVTKIAAHASSLISDTISGVGQNRLANARMAYDANRSIQGANVLKWPLDKKRTLIQGFAKNDNSLEQKLTLAARKGEDTEADIDSFLEDLIELGAIDDEGNFN